MDLTQKPVAAHTVADVLTGRAGVAEREIDESVNSYHHQRATQMDYVLFTDETGDHNLYSIDRNFAIFGKPKQNASHNRPALCDRDAPDPSFAYIIHHKRGVCQGLPEVFLRF